MIDGCFVLLPPSSSGTLYCETALSPSLVEPFPSSSENIDVSLKIGLSVRPSLSLCECQIARAFRAVFDPIFSSVRDGPDPPLTDWQEVSPPLTR